MEKLVNRVKKIAGINRDEGAREAPHLARSDYSLVSCTDLTPGAVQLWMELPEEVRYDPALAPFKRLYDKQNSELFFFII